VTAGFKETSANLLQLVVLVLADEEGHHVLLDAFLSGDLGSNGLGCLNLGVGIVARTPCPAVDLSGRDRALCSHQETHSAQGALLGVLIARSKFSECGDSTNPHGSSCFSEGGHAAWILFIGGSIKVAGPRSHKPSVIEDNGPAAWDGALFQVVALAEDVETAWITW
jgi:hypothetical protein